jgi:transcriptional regulator with XRE-family HTH domain
MRIGEGLRGLRQTRNMTLKDLAEATGLSAAMLSQVERDRTDPSLETLRRLAKALDVPVFSLLRDADNDAVAVVRRDDRMLIRSPHCRTAYARVSPGQGRLELLEGTLGPWGATSQEPWSHPSEECAVVLSGALVVEVADERYKLDTGDSCYFDSRLPHRYLNMTDAAVSFLIAITPPSY